MHPRLTKPCVLIRTLGLTSFLCLASLHSGCAHRALVCEDLSPVTSHPKLITESSEAVESANALLRLHGFDWGEPTQILRTVSQWYRIEYARDRDNRERVVLVNPETGEAEFPLPR